METSISTLLPISCCCALVALPTAFADDTTFEKRLPNGVISPDKQFLTFTIENDAFGNGTDGRLQVAYTLNWRSKEFEGQCDESLFGAISFGYRF